MRDTQLDAFHLVGGTALALKIGHRQSIDIDLFTTADFDAESLAAHLQETYQAGIKRQKTNYISGRIGNVDFDLITHDYPAIQPIETINGIRMMSLADIAAMKINAIVLSGQRLKDFIDIYYLLKTFRYEKIERFYCQKYPNVHAEMARTSLLYHQDIDFNVPVQLKDKKLKWEEVSSAINHAVKQYERLLEQRRFSASLKEAVRKARENQPAENRTIQDPKENGEDEDSEQYRGFGR